MKPRMMSKESMEYLFHHILDGFKTSHEGIHSLKEMQLVDEKEFAELLAKNSSRLIDRIKEFKLHQKLVAIVFACLFGYLQISCEDIERARRSRKGSRGRRRYENEYLEEVANEI